MESKLKWVDTHCHIMDIAQDSPEQIAKKIEQELLFAITIGTEIDDNEKIYEITKNYPNLFGTLGTHPLCCKEYNDEIGKNYERWLKDSNKIVGIGEIGLDYYKNEIDHNLQKKVFSAQLQIAQSNKMPVVIHSRESINDCLLVLKDFPKLNNIVFHCFTGTIPEAKAIMDAGYFISFTGVITFNKTDELKEIVKMVPISNLMVETDSPYLAPVPHRGKTNSPLWVSFVGEKVAELKGMEVSEINKITVENSKRFFNITL